MIDKNKFPKFDDVGSFPLPEKITKEGFRKHYWLAYRSLVNEIDIFENRGIQTYLIVPIIENFRTKLDAGVEVINYPQHIDMYKQFLKPIEIYETEPDLIQKDKAIIPEIHIIKSYAKEYYEKTGNRINLKVCVTGPIELYIKKHNFTIYYDLAMNLASSINHFIKNSLIDEKFLKTATIAIDEPSFGYTDLYNVGDEEIVQIFDKSLEDIDCDTQIHIHTLSRADIIYKTKNIDILTCEFASDPSNKVPREELVKHDKYIRVGITRTNIDGIIGEKLDEGHKWEEYKSKKGIKTLIDSQDQIQGNLKTALNHYKERLKYIGPDCGLASWKSPDVASELLRRTSKVINSIKRR
ncbi:MAG: hypothetical protein BAJALOKI2v1_510007 [Promethearchaeota archaeon]|nr:MAG: hypothetical protein BAJALOKI2v1_510007 [Candidatus Lokiarchaeota archaeon]